MVEKYHFIKLDLLIAHYEIDTKERRGIAGHLNDLSQEFPI